MRPPVVALAALGLASAAAGCMPVAQYHSQYHEPRAIPTAALAPDADATAAALAGDWLGQYDAPFYARRGPLQLSLRRVERAAGDARASTIAGTATFGGPSATTRVAVDSARVGRGRVVLFFAPLADQETGNTVQLRLDGALAADTLGGRLRGDVAATVAPEHHGGWRVVRVAPATAARTQ